VLGPLGGQGAAAAAAIRGGGSLLAWGGLPGLWLRLLSRKAAQQLPGTGALTAGQVGQLSVPHSARAVLSHPSRDRFLPSAEAQQNGCFTDSI